MDELRSEDEQVEALRRWWSENGASTMAAIVVALAAGFGWQAWTANQQTQREQASDVYEAMIRTVKAPMGADRDAAVELAQRLKTEFDTSTYAQFAALHLAAIAVDEGNFTDAQAQLRWVLSKADKGSDNAEVAQLRLARVLAAGGDSEEALSILADGASGPYAASYAAARGDILMSEERSDEARSAYNEALILVAAGGAGVSLPALQQKLQSLSPVPGRSLPSEVVQSPTATTPSEEG